MDWLSSLVSFIRPSSERLHRRKTAGVGAANPNANRVIQLDGPCAHSLIVPADYASICCQHHNSTSNISNDFVLLHSSQSAVHLPSGHHQNWQWQSAENLKIGWFPTRRQHLGGSKKSGAVRQSVCDIPENEELGDSVSVCNGVFRPLVRMRPKHRFYRGSNGSGRMGNSQQSSLVSLIQSPQCGNGANGNVRHSKFRSNSSQGSTHQQRPPSSHLLPSGSTLAPGVSVRCDWHVPTMCDTADAHGCSLDEPFVGRDWLFREVHEALLRPIGENDVLKAAVISGSAGCGKSAICGQLAMHSPFYSQQQLQQQHQSDATYQNAQQLGSGSATDSGYGGAAGGSRVSLHSGAQTQQQQHTPPPFAYSGGRIGDWLRLCANRVVAYHFCRLDDARSCSLHHVLASLAGQLAHSPIIGQAYGAALATAALGDARIRAAIDPENGDAARMEPAELFKVLICDLLAGVKPQDGQPVLLVVDGLDEAEFHRTESGVSVAGVLAQHCKHLPPHVRLVLTVSSEKRSELTGALPARPINLDDGDTDERVWRDAKDYVDWRLGTSVELYEHLLQVSNVPPGEDPLEHFACHVASVSQGNLLYLRLVIDLVECGSLRLKSANYSVLPVGLAEIYLLMVNLRYPSGRAFESAAPILSIVLASLRPLTSQQVLNAYNAGRCKDPLSPEQFDERLALLQGILVRRQIQGSEGSPVLCLAHSSLRAWLVREPSARGGVHRYLVDPSKRDAFLRTGHILLALWLRQSPDGLNSADLHTLGHHLLKAHAHRHLSHSAGANAGATLVPGMEPTSASAELLDVCGPAGKELQLAWIRHAARDIERALCSEEQLACPNTKVACLLLASGASPVACLSDGTPLLCRAAAAGHADLCSVLCEFGANCEAGCATLGRTPLMLAAAGGHLDVVQILHQCGAKLCATDVSGRTALCHGAAAGHVPVLSFLLQCDWNGDDATRQRAIQQALCAAAAAGHLRAVEFLVEMAGANVNTPTNSSGRSDASKVASGSAMAPCSGDTALTSACRAAKPAVVRYLLEQGANGSYVNMPVTSRPCAPLACAVQGGSWEIVSVLLATGVDVDSERGEQGATPLMLAARLGNIGIVELLLSRGANVASVDRSQRTALHYAAERNQAACSALLLDRGAPADPLDGEGMSPLHVGALNGGGRRLVQSLIDRGADTERGDGKQRRPIDLAVESGNEAALQCFLRRGAKLSARTWTAALQRDTMALALLHKLADDGALLYKRGRVDEAKHRYQYALKKCAQVQCSPALASNMATSERLSAVHYALLVGAGRCHRRRGDLQQAVECCTSAVALKVPSAGFEAYFLRAKCRFDAQDLCAAVSDAERAVRLCPDSEDARRLLAALRAANDANPLQVHTNHQASSSEAAPNRTSHASTAGNQPSTSTSSPHRILPSAQRSAVTPDASAQLGSMPNKSVSPAECSSDSGNQADYDERRLSAHSPARS